MRFDAYAGNVSGSKPEEVACLVAHATAARVSRGRPRGRYHDVFDVKVGADLVGWVGHDFQLDTAFFEFKGGTTPDAASAIRRHWPGAHTVSRADACEDFTGAGCYPQLLGVVDSCLDPRVKSRQIAPRLGSDDGITTYWGSPKSRLSVRLYEAGKMLERRHLGVPDWVRLEAQVRPGKAVEKVAAAKASPLELWGWAAWARRVAERISQVEVPRFAPPVSEQHFDKTTAYLARAHRKHWEAMLEDFGDWQCIGREFQAIWLLDDEAKAATELATRRAKA